MCRPLQILLCKYVFSVRELQSYTLALETGEGTIEGGMRHRKREGITVYQAELFDLPLMWTLP